MSVINQIQSVSSDHGQSPITQYLPGMTHCLTFDIEEHFQVSAFESPMRRRQWDQFESRVEKNTYKILEMLRADNARATFFTLGWIAERHPGLVRSIVAEGHEVASHGYEHERITAQTPDQYRADIRKAKQLLEDIVGKPILGYRAPSFTIIEETQWALPILVEEGYRYDSSIFPIMHDRYGMPGSPAYCHERTTPAGTIWEVPPSTLVVAGIRVPIAGGGYFRLFPYALTYRLLNRAVATGHPLVMYFHPWELDPEQPKMTGSRLARFRHYVNLDKTERRLHQLLKDFSFAPICESITAVKAWSSKQ